MAQVLPATDHSDTGRPAARQRSLQQAVHMELVCQRVHLKIPAGEFTRQSETHAAPKTVQNIARPRRAWANPSPKEVRRQRWQHTVELFQMVKSLRAQGAKVISIMRQVGISRGLADKWLRLEECPPRAKRTSRPGMAEDFREELWRRWEQGQQEGKQLFAEIRQHRKLRLANEISVAVAGSARRCGQGSATQGSQPPRGGAACFAASRGGTAEQAETAVDWQAERDGEDSQAPLSRLCGDAALGAELS